MLVNGIKKILLIFHVLLLAVAGELAVVGILYSKMPQIAGADRSLLLFQLAGVLACGYFAGREAGRWNRWREIFHAGTLLVLAGCFFGRWQIGNLGNLLILGVSGFGAGVLLSQEDSRGKLAEKTLFFAAILLFAGGQLFVNWLPQQRIGNLPEYQERLIARLQLPSQENVRVLAVGVPSPELLQALLELPGTGSKTLLYPGGRFPAELRKIFQTFEIAGASLPAKLPGQAFDLIILGELSASGDAAVRNLVKELLRNRAPDGVMILPLELGFAAAALEGKEHSLRLRGGKGGVLLSRRNDLSVAPEELEQRFRKLCGDSMHNSIYPEGCFAELCRIDAELTPPMPAEDRPADFWGRSSRSTWEWYLLLLPAGLALLQLRLRTWNARLAVLESDYACSLLLLLAISWLDRGMLTQRLFAPALLWLLLIKPNWSGFFFAFCIAAGVWAANELTWTSALVFLLAVGFAMANRTRRYERTVPEPGRWHDLAVVLAATLPVLGVGMCGGGWLLGIGAAELILMALLFG
ncbi:MAG: hypothetical protein PHS41_10180 [Victivallaceae bacterium]|nr:hypothetical protein [Victivallaceae bacterium]